MTDVALRAAETPARRPFLSPLNLRRLANFRANRRGLWSLSDRTPFGYGQPYSLGQLQRTLNGHLFTPGAERTALFMPPTQSRLLQRLAVPAERLGLSFARRLAGVVLIEAEKQIYVGTAVPALRAGRARRYVPMMEGLAAARDRAEAPARTRDSRHPGTIVMLAKRSSVAGADGCEPKS